MSIFAELYRRNRNKAAAYDREEALRESRKEKEFLSALLEQSSQPFAVGYPDGRLGKINSSFERLTGYTAAELRAIDWSATLTPPEWRELETQKLDELHRTGQPVRYEKEYIRKDGSRVSIELFAHLVRNANGEPEYYYSFISDITERKQAEEQLNRALKETRQRIGETEAVLAAMNDAVLVYDSDMFVQRVNPGFIPLYGFDPLGLNVRDIIRLTRCRQLDESPIPLDNQPNPLAFQGEKVINQQLRITRHDGQERILETSATPLKVGDRISGTVTVWHDITERKRAEEALWESQEREHLYAAELQAVLETAPIAMWIAHDPECMRITGNAAADRLLQAPRSANISASAPPDKAAVAYRVFRGDVELRPEQMPAQLATATGRPVMDEELDLVFADGRRIHLIESAVPLIDADGRVRGAVIAGQDITGRKKAEEEIRHLNENLEARIRQRTEELAHADEELRKSQNLLNETQHISKVGGWEFDVATARVSWTDEVYRIHEVPETFDPGNAEQDIQFYAPEDRKLIADAFRRAMEQAEPYDLELQLVTAQGNPIWIRTMGQAESKDGKVVRLSGNIMDISEIKKAREELIEANVMLEQRVAERTTALRESQEDLNRAQAVAHTGSWRLDIRRNELLWSEENWRIFGVPKGTTLTYETFLATIHPDDRAFVHEKWSAALRGEPYDIEHRIIVGDMVKWLREHAELEFDSTGVLLGGFGITQDITVQKEVQATLDRMRVMLAEGQRIAHVGSWEYLADTQTTVWSEEQCRIYGIDPAAGAPSYAVMLARHIHPDDAAALQETFTAALRNREVYEQEHRIVRPDGRVRVLYERALPCFDEGGRLIKYMGASLDITERKQAEEALRKS
ncbi:MAG: PAS domain S-box protein, partial [Victivallales bacterium]